MGIDGPIPRASTCPAHLCGGSSPRAVLRGLPTSWRRPAAAAAGAGADAAAGLAGRLSSRRLLLVTILLYSLALVGLPLLYSSFGGRWTGSTHPVAAAGSSSGSGSDLQTAALAEGVPQADPLPWQQQQRQRLAAVFSSRRMALQRGTGTPALAATPAAAASAAAQAAVAALASQLWPEAGLRQQLLTAARPQEPRVEYRDAGHVVSLVDALNSSAWEELPLYRANPLPGMAQPEAPTSAGGGSSSGGGGSAPGQGTSSQQDGAAALAPPAPPHFPVQCPQGEIRLFIGITSRCCTEEAQAKRDAIRRTWVQYAKDHLPGITARFILAQPASEAEMRAAVGLLGGEIQRHADIIIVPGTDVYRNLPSKTLQMLRYALSSECQYTHVLKADDDVYLRPQMLMDIIQTGHYNFSVDVQYDGSGAYDGRPASYYQAPWMSSMYVGQLDSQKSSGVYPGWSPNRQPRSKWYLSEQDLPDEFAPLGVRWASGWGYMLSRDLAEFISNTALMYAAVPERKPLWWGRMPWEDIMVGAMLKGVARVHHHDGFKAAWQECDRHTVLKHLDNDAPSLQEGLYVQELSGLWSKKSVVCSSGVFELGNHSDWRLWRNSLPDNQIGGFM